MNTEIVNAEIAAETQHRKFHVKVFFAHVKGSEFVDCKESVITFARAYTVNDVYVSEDWAELRFSPFGELALSSPDDGRAEDLVAPYQELLDSITLDDRLDYEGVVIPVSTIEFVEGNWFDS